VDITEIQKAAAIKMRMQSVNSVVETALIKRLKNAKRHAKQQLEDREAEIEFRSRSVSEV
jgi:hypothetical protein